MSSQSESKRVKILRMSREFLIFPYKEEGIFFLITKENKLPADSKVVDVEYDAYHDELKVVIESKEFEPVLEGSAILNVDNPIMELHTAKSYEKKEGAITVRI